MYNLIEISKIIDDKVILDNINLQLPRTGFVIIKGENGAGKSTLLNILGGLDKPTNGKIYFDKTDLTLLTETELCKYREKYISFIFQNNNLFEASNVKDNITIVGNDTNFSNVVNYLNLQDLLTTKVKSLSGGEQQKVAIARSLMKKSKVILIDEATSALDNDMKNKVFSYLKQLSNECLIIMITHDINYIYEYADIIVELAGGKIINIIKQNQETPDNNILIYKNKFNSLKFVVNNLFVNKKRMVLSSILLMLSFIFIWIAMALSSLDFKSLHFDTMKLENDNLILFEKNKYVNNSYIFYHYFEDNDIKYLNDNKITNKDLIIGKTMNVDGNPINFSINYNRNIKIPYYQHTMLNKLSFINARYLEKVDYGRKPNESNEIVISSYLADLMIEFGVMDYNKEIYKPKDYKSLISENNLLILGTSNVKVVGIYNIDFAKADVLKKEYDKINSKIENINSIFGEKLENMAGNIYIVDSFFENYSNIKPVVKNDYGFKWKKDSNELLGSNPIVFTNEEVELIDGNKVNTLGDNEIIVSEEIIRKMKLDEDTCIGQKIKFWIYGATV